MANFAKVVNNKIVNIINAEQDFINTLSDKDFYIKDDETKINVAQVNGSYDATQDAFILPKPHSSWTLNNSTLQWEAPTSMPDDENNYTWNNETTSWEEVA